MTGTDRIEVTKLAKALGKGFIKAKVDRGETFICVHRDHLIKALETLRDDPELDYSYFSECVGVDYSTWTHERDFTERFEVVYNLMSLKTYSRIFVKVGVNDGEEVPSVMHVFAGAEYPEKEIQDLFGISFSGNEPTAGLRFMMPDDWIGYPLRKEVPLGGEDVNFDAGTRGPAVEDKMLPHAGESFEGKTGSSDVSGR